MAHFKITGIGKQPEVRVLMGKPLAAVLVVGATHEGVDLRRVVDVAATRYHALRKASQLPLMARVNLPLEETDGNE